MRTFTLILLVSTLVISQPGVVFAESGNVQIFDGGLDQVFDATVKAVDKNWKKTKSSDRATGTIRFHTGVSPSTWGEDCTAVLRDLGNGKIEVSLKSTNSAQLYAWGVGGRIAQKLFKSIQDGMATSSPPSKASPTTPVVHN